MPQDEQLDDYSPDLITLTDEDGKEFSFEVIDAADYNDERYLAVVPYAEDSTERWRRTQTSSSCAWAKRTAKNIWTLWMTMRSFTR